ncbi:MAG: hypothetical protein E6013_19370, partial [Citrobacter freundii]|nr:hypothetical protein [Citrobacter freundii]
GSAAKTPNDRVDRAMAATANLIFFMINLSQGCSVSSQCSLRRRCSVDVISITFFWVRENRIELTTSIKKIE